MPKLPNNPEYKIAPMGGHPYVEGAARIVCLAESNTDKFVNAGKMLASANDKINKAINYAISTWEQKKRNDKHHGWDSTEHGGAYTNCYVFKFTAKHVRVYGYLFHPADDKQTTICCVVHYNTKKEHKVDTALLDELNRCGTKLKTMNAVEEYLKEMKRVKKEEQL